MMGMGNANSAITDEWTLFNNIGGLGRVKQATAIFGYEARPALIGANRLGAGFIMPFKFGTLGIGAHRFGDDLYNEHLVSAGFGNQFGNTSLGIRVNYIQYRADFFGSHDAITLDFGGITQITDQLYVGAFILNITQSRLEQTDEEKLPTKLIVGVGFKPDDKILITSDIEKDIDYKPTWKVGIEYFVYQKIAFRTGYNLRPSAFFMGCGFQKKNLKVDYAIKLADPLGTTHQASASFIISKKEKK